MTKGSAENVLDKKHRPVYMVVSGDTIDVARMATYAQSLGNSGLYEQAQGYYLNMPRPVEVFEGNPSSGFVTLIVRFPSIYAARDFWYSKTYQDEIRPLRLSPSAGSYVVTVYEEAALPPYMAGRVGSSDYTAPPFE